jgi:pimeloyl-ACP methyl ester carboxylesterase
VARAWAELMRRLGYGRYLAHGGDWGSAITRELGLADAEHLAALHVLQIFSAAVTPETANLDDPEERRSVEAGKRYRGELSGYSTLQMTRPQLISYALTDSPVGQLAWILERFQSWTDSGGDLWSVLTRDQVLDDVTLYWLTRTAASSARLYWESIATVQRWMSGPPPDVVAVPTACSVFRDVPRPSRRWAEQRFRDIRSWSEPGHGGHFAAMEQPNLFVREVQAGFSAVLSV